jgi:hypothetical protein
MAKVTFDIYTVGQLRRHLQEETLVLGTLS